MALLIQSTPTPETCDRIAELLTEGVFYDVNGHTTALFLSLLLQTILQDIVTLKRLDVARLLEHSRPLKVVIPKVQCFFGVSIMCNFA